MNRLFNYLYGPEAREAFEYWKEQGVMVPLGVMVFFALCWLFRVGVELI